MKTLYFGGSFNPIGIHHLIMAEHVMDSGLFDRLYFVPCYDAPHKNNLISFEHRYEMCRIASNYYHSPYAVSDIERSLFNLNGRKSYTIETVREIANRTGQDKVTLLLGSDSFNDIPKWREPEALLREAHFVVAPRLKDGRSTKSGFAELFEFSHPMLKGATIIHVPNLPVIDVSASIIRHRRRAGKSIRFHVTRGVEEYIISNGLYADDPIISRNYNSGNSINIVINARPFTVPNTPVTYEQIAELAGFAEYKPRVFYRNGNSDSHLYLGDKVLPIEGMVFHATCSTPV